MVYVHTSHYTIRWKIAIPAMFVLALLIYSCISFMIPEAEINKFTIGNLNEEETLSSLNHKRDDVFMVEDYTYYGESLGLYSEAYKENHNDNMVGKTMKLTNVCTKKTVTITLDEGVDQKIFLPDLEPGFYEMIIIDNLVEKTLIYKEEYKSKIMKTIPRDGKIMEASLIASNDLLKDYGIKWDHYYLFLEVKERKPIEKMVDVYIDPYGLNTDFQYVPDKGSIGNGLEEYKETVIAANYIKKRLESYGLRVELTRNNVDDQPLAAYGKDGRLARGYASGARYYIHLQMNHNEIQSGGYEIWHSAYVSDVIGTRIMYGLQKTFNVQTSLYPDPSGSGVGMNFIDKKYYDSNMFLRESGGKATFAARYSQLAQEQNADFKDEDGLYGIEIDLGYVTNKKDADLWKANKEGICNQIADSFVEAIAANK